MRYRLRTLLMFFTAVGLFFGWIAWLRQSAAFHRRESSRIVSMLAHCEATTPDYVEERVAALAQGRSITKWVKAANGNGEKCTLLKNGGHMTLSDSVSVDVEDWGSAVYHVMMTDRFDRAIYRPWILLCESMPTPETVYVPLSEDKTWSSIARPPMVELKE